MKNRIGKNEMLEQFQIKYPKKRLTVTQLMNSLREKKLYSHKLRMNGVQGCYYGIKFRDEEEYDDDFNADTFQHEGIDFNRSIKMTDLTAKQQYEYLHKQQTLIRDQMFKLTMDMIKPLTKQTYIVPKQPTKKLTKQVEVESE